jgi:hypothetical protein
MAMLCINLNKKWVGLHFEQLDQKLIWPPCVWTRNTIEWRQFLKLCFRVLNVASLASYAPFARLEFAFQKQECKKKRSLLRKKRKNDLC